MVFSRYVFDTCKSEWSLNASQLIKVKWHSLCKIKIKCRIYNLAGISDQVTTNLMRFSLKGDREVTT